MNEVDWPPNLTIKKHPRARNIKFKASLKKGLELIVPPRFNFNDIPFLIEKNREWIEKQLLKIQSHEIVKNTLPDKIHLQAIDQLWKVEYIASNKKLQLMIRPQQQEMVLFGQIEKQLQCKKLLTTWVKDKAKQHLPLQLEKISHETQLSFSSVTIRDQNTRWGSCTINKSINLNFKLLFLPYELMRHVIIHELCHTIHLNHSDAFWSLVNVFDVNWQINRRILRQTEKFIPSWL